MLKINLVYGVVSVRPSVRPLFQLKLFTGFRWQVLSSASNKHLAQVHVGVLKHITSPPFRLVNLLYSNGVRVPLFPQVYLPAPLWLLGRLHTAVEEGDWGWIWQLIVVCCYSTCCSYYVWCGAGDLAFVQVLQRDTLDDRHLQLMLQGQLTCRERSW